MSSFALPVFPVGSEPAEPELALRYHKFPAPITIMLIISYCTCWIWDFWAFWIRNWLGFIYWLNEENLITYFKLLNTWNSKLNASISLQNASFKSESEALLFAIWVKRLFDRLSFFVSMRPNGITSPSRFSSRVSFAFLTASRMAGEGLVS